MTQNNILPLRKPIIAGNWKMNTTLDDAKALTQGLVDLCSTNSSVDIVLCPPSVNLAAVGDIISSSPIKLGAQNVHDKDSGAFTGEVSANMLTGIGCSYVIIGHSERREIFKETNEFINRKIKAAFSHDLTPILCVGESLEQREADTTFDVIETQLKECLAGSESTLSEKEIVIAYEPIWAIGTGKVATPEQAQEVHAFIRKTLTGLLSETIAQSIRIQYGGSVKPDNAATLLSQADIDGALVGGASLKADVFAAIIQAAN